MTVTPGWQGTSCRTRNGELLTLRHCEGMAEFEACVDLQRQTWGYPDLEVTPRKSFLLAQELGGQVIGAFDQNGTMAGMVMAMAALAPSTAGGHRLPVPYLHSHMLAVLPGYRDQGLGTRLKLAQREDALARGISRMTWTFDPLAAKNAYLNLHRLGAVARRYSRDFYGVSSSRLQGGLPTDRLHAEWWLRSSGVEACVRALSGAGRPPEKEPTSSTELSRDGSITHPIGTILLPHEVEEWKQSDRHLEQLRELQTHNGSLFLEAFARGLAVIGFSRDARGNGVFELAAWPGDEPWT